MSETNLNSSDSKVEEFSNRLENLPDIDYLVVQKSRPLLALWQSSLTLAEFKILDVYLGRINSRDSEHRTVVFSKGELEQILGIEQIKPLELDERLAHLMTSVRIPDSQNSNEFTRITLFEKAHARKDENKMWQVELTCTESAKEYIFNIEGMRYLRYKLKCITSMKSRYTYILFLYLWENKYRKSWKVALNELKELLGCDQDAFYEQFKYFNQRILKKAQEEIKNVTDFKYTYEPIKKARTVIGIQFVIESLPKIEEDENKLLSEDNKEQPLKTVLDDICSSKERFDEIMALLAMVPKSKLPADHSIEEAKRLYLVQKVVEIKRRESEKEIRNKFLYLKKMIEKDVYSISKGQQNDAVARGTQVFQNFTERQDNNYTDKIMDKLKSDLKEFQENQSC